MKVASQTPELPPNGARPKNDGHDHEESDAPQNRLIRLPCFRKIRDRRCQFIVDVLCMGYGP